MRSSLVVVSLALLLAGCSGSASSTSAADGGTAPATLHACSPLEGAPQPIKLANVLGAGRHADGTVYVLDDGVAEYRAFISEGTALQRKVVSGSGTAGGGAGEMSITATVTNGASPFALKIERTNGIPTRMGVLRGELADKSFEIGVQGDVLTLVGADVLAAFEVRNLPGVAVAEFDASTQDGHRIFVTRPAVDWKYEDFRVFFGTPDRMLERRLVSAKRGSTTFITFDLDGMQPTAIFPSSLSPVQDTARLATENASQPLTVVASDAGVPGAGLSFLCL